MLKLTLLLAAVLSQTPVDRHALRITERSLHPTKATIVIFEDELPGDVGLCLPEGDGLICTSLRAFRERTRVP